MAVCSKCKQENDDYRLRCGHCGNTLSKRGEFKEQQGPQVVVLGSVEDLKRAREQGDIDPNEDDPTALGWLESGEGELPSAPAKPAPGVSGTRRVSVREIDKISGLRDLRELQAALLKADEEAAAPPPPPITESRRIASPAADPGVGTDSRRFKKSDPANPTSDSRRAARPGSGLDAGSRGAAPPRAMAPAKADSADHDLEEIPVGPPTAYLVNELIIQPFALSPGRRYLMGRDPRASIFLPSTHVSRRHAGIAADEKGDYWIEDLRSSNGTYVNGRAVLKRRLKHGDLLDVGVFTFRFRTVQPGEAAPENHSETGEETRALRCVPGALSGEIERNGVVPVLALICSARRSGVLTLRAGSQCGRIFVIEGEVHHAQFGKATGEAALAALLPAEGGFLHFSDERIQVKRTITRSTDEIFGG